MSAMELHDALLHALDKVATRHGISLNDFTFVAQYDDSQRLARLTITADVKSLPPVEDKG